MENNGSTAPVLEEQIQQQEVADAINQPNEKEAAQQTSENIEQPQETEVVTGESEAAEQSQGTEVATGESEVAEQSQETEVATVESEAAEQPQGTEVAAGESEAGTEAEEEKDFSSMTKEEIVEYLAQAIQTMNVVQLRQIVDKLKISFYRQHNIEVKTKELADEPIEEDPIETRFKELMGIYKSRKEQFIVAAEHEKEINYKTKLAIIEELKTLTESNEILNSTFTKFRELQNRWREVGLVPQGVVNDLWETYNHYTEIFYNWIKINKELRDFDLKRNLEAKTKLCERAEKLFECPSAVESFHDLQNLHDEWREIGPVATEVKEALWERFKEASSRINKRHQEYFEQVKEDQLKNLRLKEELCERIEGFQFDNYKTHKEWEETSDKILEIQKIWKTIGFAPKKDNGPIYERYRKACDKFFEAKHKFTDDVKKVLDENYKAKVQICQQAEEFLTSLAESVDWKQSTEFILSLQKHWKEIGPTARKHSDALWARFRTSCDKFFEAKSEHFKESESDFMKHLEEKKQLLEQIKQTAEGELSFDLLKGFQEKWTSIGFVPIKEKEKLQKEFKETMDGLYKLLKGNESERRVEGYRRRIQTIRQNGHLGSEHDKLVQKMHQLESQISVLENNIGFFGNSKKAETLIKDVRTKIQATKAELKEVIEKIKMIEKENG